MTTWNPADKDAAITLSGADLTATNGATGAWRSVRATTGQITGKWYFECTVTALDGTGIILGLANASAALNNYAGSDAYGAGYQVQTSLYGFSATSNGATFNSGAGQIVAFAVDFGTGNTWLFNGGTWNSGSGNPAAGTGGNTINGTVNDGIAVFPMFSGFFLSGGSGMTLNAGGTAFAYTVPSGFTGWDLTPVPPILGAGSMMLMGIGS